MRKRINEALLTGIFAFVNCCSNAGAQDESNFDRFMKAGEGEYRAHDFEKADQSFANALEEAEKFGKEDKHVVNALNFCALVSSARGDHSRAIRLQERALKMNEKLNGHNSENVAYDLAHLAMWYEANKQKQDSEETLKRSIEVKQNLYGSQSAPVAASLCTLADFYLRQKRFADAVASLNKAIKFYEASDRYGAAMQTTNKLVEFYKTQNRQSDIEKLYQQEIARQEKSLGSYSLALATTLLTLAEHYTDRQKYAQAEPVLRRALAIQRMTIGDDRSLTAETTYNLAVTLTNEGKWGEAEPMFKKAIAVLSRSKQRQVVPAMMGDYADCLEKLGKRSSATQMRAAAKKFNADPH